MAIRSRAVGEFEFLENEGAAILPASLIYAVNSKLPRVLNVRTKLRRSGFVCEAVLNQTVGPTGTGDS